MPKKKVDKTMAAQDPAADQDPNAPKNPEAKSKPKGCVGAVSQILWKVVRGKKNKVKPEDEAKKTMSAEEIKAKVRCVLSQAAIVIAGTHIITTEPRHFLPNPHSVSALCVNHPGGKEKIEGGPSPPQGGPYA